LKVKKAENKVKEFKGDAIHALAADEVKVMTHFLSMKPKNHCQTVDSTLKHHTTRETWSSS